MIFELSNRARSDIANIIRYTIENFGQARAEKYVGGLYNSFDLLTANPKLGREWKSERQRYIYRSHYVYYRVTPRGIFVTHIRHTSQDPI